MNEGTKLVVLDKLKQEIKIGSKVVVVGGQGALQRMIVEGFSPRGTNIKCRPTDEDSFAKVKKLFTKSANECVVIDELMGNE
jgi:hypothetical protein